MNDIKEIDILDKSTLALSNLFNDSVTLHDEKMLPNNKTGIDGMLSINATNLPFIILKRPTIGTISKRVKDIGFPSKTLNSPLFIVDYASNELIHFFRKQNLFFIDTAGNCFINLPTLKVSVEGRENILPIPNEKRAFQKTGLKLLFQLFKNHELVSEPYRTIAKKTEISSASVSYIFEELKNDGFIIEINEHKRQLANIKRLITKWAISYSENLRQKIHRGYFIALDSTIFTNNFFFKKNENAAYIGGEFGAYLFNHSIKPKKLILYTNMRLSYLVEKYQIVPMNKSANTNNGIEILEQFWIDEQTGLPTNSFSTSNIADPILIYADLLLSNNYRSIETAEEILNNEIRDRFLRHHIQW